MTPLELDFQKWKNGDSCSIGKFTIKPKRDMAGFTDTHGWVVTDGGIVNVLPGATWAKTMDEAIALMHIFVAIGGDVSEIYDKEKSIEVGQKFWALVRAFQFYSVKV